jgi:hypothetical protein
MSIVPIEFERVCERRWIGKPVQPASRPLYAGDRADSGEATDLTAPKLNAEASKSSD